MSITSSLEPISAGDFGPAQARHLLIRAGFGAKPLELRGWQAMELDQAVKSLVEYNDIPTPGLEPADLDPDVIRTPTLQERLDLQMARRESDQKVLDQAQRDRVAAQFEDRRMHAQLQRWWLDRMARTPRPTEEQLTLLWHGHFATRHRDVRDAYLMEKQNAMLREHANGSFADLALGIIHDPAMIKFLNNDQNRKLKPNENLARELMELFTLGEGHYTEDDIKQGARALTGYHVDDNDYLFNPNQHDNADKTILGFNGPINGDSFVKILLKQPACSQFIALKLYRHFVADVSDSWDLLDSTTQQVVEALARQLRENDYQIAPVLTTLLKSKHFYDPGIVGQKIKSPVQVTVGTIRQTGAPMRDERGLVEALNLMGQDLFEPPSVAGWEGGRSWINTSTLFLRQNTSTYLITGKAPGKQFNKSDIAFDPMALLEGLDDRGAESATNYLCDALLGRHVSAARREPLIRFMKERSNGVTGDSLVALLLLITAMPEYQLC